jgi:hypothetical protein
MVIMIVIFFFNEFSRGHSCNYMTYYIILHDALHDQLEYSRYMKRTEKIFNSTHVVLVSLKSRMACNGHVIQVT